MNNESSKYPPSPPISGSFFHGGMGSEYTRPVPFFHRLGVKHGIILSLVVLLAMAVLTAEQLRETLREIRRDAIDRGHGVATAVAPLIMNTIEQRRDLERLKSYFNAIARAREISYVQIVNPDGSVELSSDPGPGNHPARPLSADWLSSLNAGDRTAADQPWEAGNPGVDVFVALLPPGKAVTNGAPEPSLLKHLRIGVNFDTMVKDDTPRVIAQMVYFTVVLGFIMVMGLVILLSYIMHPLRQLRLGFFAVARGDLDYRVPVQSKDEVGQIVQLFNATIDRLRLAFREIEQLARHDPLTGLSNRRAFDERLSAEAARSRRYGHPFGVIIIDLDLFKSVNDRYGHPIGDEVLKFVGKTVDANIRETDLASRIGGEEFAVILPESTIEDVRAVAEKLREAVSEGVINPGPDVPDGIRITLSAGAACSAGHLVTPESIVAAADAALFRSKNAGRNRVTIAPPMAGKTRVMLRTEADKAQDAAKLGVPVAPASDASDAPAGAGSKEGN